MSLYLYLDAVTNLYILKHKGFVFNPKAGSLMLIEREEDGFVNLQALYDNKAFRQNTNGHILNDFIDPETVVNELGVSYGNDAQAIRTALADFFVDAPSGGGGLSVEQVKSQSTTKAPSSKLFADVTGDLELGFKSSIASLENVINSANINQELTATATGVDTVALPKTAANTGMQVQMFGQSAQNLVVNGDFRNGTTGWNITNSTSSLSGGVLTMLSNNYTSGRAGRISKSFSRIIGNVYYIYSRVKASTNQVRISHAGAVIGQAHSGNNTFERLSMLFTPTTAGDISPEVSDFRTTGWDEFQVDYIGCINLTATFGAGNEPTKEQCDVLFANYFEGSDNVIGTGRVRSVGNNLIKPTYIQGFQVSTTDGTFVAGATFSRSDYFRVAASTAYILSSNTNTGTDHRIAFYDLNKVFISGATQTSGQPISVTSPANAYYAIVSSLTTKVDTFRLTRGTSLFETYRESILQLTTPELRSNGLIKDGIRKGTNGYELVKMVGVGTLGANGISGGDFEGGLIGVKIDELGSVSTWTLNTINPISGVQDGRLQVTTIGTSSARPFLQFTNTRVVGQYRKISFNYKLNSGTCILSGFLNGGSLIPLNLSLTGSGMFVHYFIAIGTNGLVLYFDGRNLFDLQIDNVKDELINTSDGTATGSTATVIGSNVHYTLATPTVTPIAHAGILNSNSNGTAYFEPIIADAGVYSTNLAVQLTDYPITSFESIRKYANGTYTELNIATAVKAGDGLSFTHPDLNPGDLVMFTYAYNRESIGRSMTLTHYDSRFVIADTANSKVYRWRITSTNGVASIALTEV